MLKKRKYLILFFSLSLSVLWSHFNLQNFDKIKLNYENKYYNQFLYEDLASTWDTAYKFKQNLDSEKSFFESLPKYERFFLPSIIVGYYYHLIDKDIYKYIENNQRVIKEKNYKFGIIIFQILVYYFSVIFFTNVLRPKISKNLYTIILLYLCYEPSILQWHSSLWSESFFLSLQLFLMSLIFKGSTKSINNIFIGLILGLLLCQRSVSFGYAFIVIFFYIIFQKNLKSLMLITFSFLIVISFLIFNNFKKTNAFYLLPTHHQFYSYYHYFGASLLADRLNLTKYEAANVFEKNETKWRNDNNINLENKADLLKNIDYRNKIFFEEVIKNPIFFMKKLIKKTATMFILDPLWVHESFYVDKTDPKAINDPKSYYNKNIYYKIAYSIVIYFFAIIGLFKFLKGFSLSKKKSDYSKFLIFNILSVLYFAAISGLWGNPKYLVPCMISICLFFSSGLTIFSKYLQNLVKN